jgi:DNA-binding MarR family transcriptional regulator
MTSRPNRAKAPAADPLGAPFSDDELAAWHGMLRTHVMVIRELDEQLERHHRMSVSEFDVLITLDNAPDGQLRMSDLADDVMLSPSGLTRLVARLERDELVARRPDPNDGRSSLAQLLPAGRDALAAARRTHNRVIRQRYLDRLSSDDRRALARAWAKVHDEAPPT